MTKAEYKREKQKLLIHRNTIISRIRTGDKSILAELAAIYGEGLAYKDYITKITEHHAQKEKELNNSFQNPTRKNEISDSRKEILPREGENNKKIESGPDKQDTKSAETSSPEKEIIVPQSRYSKDFLKPKYLDPNRNRTAELRNWQRDAADTLRDRIIENYPMTFLRSGTGTGKTFMIGDVIQQLHDCGWFAKKWPTFYPVLIVTANAVVEQFRNDLIYRFGLKEQDEFHVLNYEQLRSKYGKQHIKTEEYVDEEGEIQYKYEWMKCLNPHLIVWDEAHKLKNEQSTQHKIAMAINDLPDNFKTIQVSMSATPWTRIADCKHFACSAGLDTNI